MRAASYTVTSVDFYLVTRCYTPEENTLHSHHCENINSNFDSSKDLNDPTAGSCILLGEIAQMLKTFPPLYGTEMFSTVFTISCS
jgi:hypothetical protein